MLVRPRQRREDQVGCLHAERVGERRGEDRDRRLERVGQGVDAGVRRDRLGHRHREVRVDDRHVGDERVVDQRHLALAHADHRRRRDLRTRARRGRNRHQPHLVRDLREVGDALARVEERQRELADRELRALVEQPHRLGGIHHRAAADRDDRVGVHQLQLLDSGADLRFGRLGLDPGVHVHRVRGQVVANLLGHPAGHRPPVGDDHRPGDVEQPQVVQRPRIEVRVRRDPEPLRGRLPPRHHLDVQQVAIVGVVGRVRSPPRSAPERERRGHRVVDAAQRSDRGRGVDQDPSRPDREGEAIDHLAHRSRTRPRYGRGRGAR